MASLLRRIGIVAVVTVVALFGNPSVILPGSSPEQAPFELNARSAIDWLQATDLTYPQEWAGIWSIDETDVDCLTDERTPRGTIVDTLCTGTSVGGGGNPIFELTCTGTIDANSFDITCTASVEFTPDCTQNFSIHQVGQRNGETAQIATEVNITYVGTICPFPDTCQRTESVATRIGPEPVPCTTPVEPSTWGAIKERFQ